MFSRLHLKYKLIIGFILVALFTLVVGGVDHFYTKKVIEKFNHVVEINMANLEKMTEMRDSVRVQKSEMSLLIGLNRGHEEEIKKAHQRINEEYSRYEKFDKEYQGIPFVEGEEAIYNKVDESWKKLKLKSDELLALIKKDSNADRTNEFYFKEYEPASNAYNVSIENLMKFQSDETVKWTELSKKTADFASVLSLAIMLAGFIVSLILGFVLSGKISGQLESAIKELNISAPELISASNELGSMSTSLSSNATEQAAAVQETASSMEEISAMIKKNSDHAGNAMDSSSESLISVKKGQDAVANLMQAMNDINVNNEAFNEFMEKNNDELKEMVNVINNISDKTKIINDIVFQTKLLSFNASVEAARAGEMGKGFAVVAEEVGNLAQMSGNAANEIKGLLEDSIAKVNDIVHKTKSQVEIIAHEGKVKIETGVDRAKVCNGALNEIAETVMRVQSLVTEVSIASKEQSQGISEVNKAMGQIDEVTNQSSFSSQKVADNASQVLSLSHSVKKTSDILTELLQGQNQDQGTKTHSDHVIKRENLSLIKSQNDFDSRTSNLTNRKMVDEKKSKSSIKLVQDKSKKMKADFTQSGTDSAERASHRAKQTNEAALPSYDDKRFEDV